MRREHMVGRATTVIEGVETHFHRGKVTSDDSSATVPKGGTLTLEEWRAQQDRHDCAGESTNGSTSGDEKEESA